MRLLFTGFTSRTTGSERLQYDYMSNVAVLEQALRLAGHEVDVRQVSLETDPCIEEDYDAALVGIAACQGLSSRFKLGALWTLSRFGKRAGLFPSDGRNIYMFNSSVLTCLSGEHYDKIAGRALDPVEYFLGDLQQEKNNVVDTELGHREEFKRVWKDTLALLPHSLDKPYCAWSLLIPTHSWGSELVYRRHFGASVALWDPTNIAIPMQFKPEDLGPDGRLPFAGDAQRERRWVLSSLQDQGQWLKRQGCKWPVVTIGNKRAARAGAGVDYVPEDELIKTFYRDNWGHLAFGYPLADGGWWRCRYIHAALAGIVTLCDEADARKMPPSYQLTRPIIEGMTNDRLAALALRQHQDLTVASWPADAAVKAVDSFVRNLVEK